MYRLFSYLTPHKWPLFFGTALLIAAKMGEALVPMLLGTFTNTLLIYISEKRADSLLPFLIPRLSFLFFLLLGIYSVEMVIVRMKNSIGKRALTRLRKEVYEKILSMPISFFNRNKVGTLMTRVVHDVDQIHQMFAESVIPLIGGVFLFLFAFIALFLFDLRLGLLMSAILLPLSLLINHFRIHQSRCYAEVRRSVAVMNAFVQEHILGMTTIRSFGLGEREKGQFDRHNQVYRDANVETIHYFALFFAGIDWLQNLALIGLFVILSFSTQFAGGTFLAFSLYILILFRPLADLTERYNVLQAAMASANRLFQLLDLPSEPLGKGLEIDTIKSVRFEDIWFAYEGDDWILKGLNLFVSEGESVALVGQTGNGKTTILNLLLGFYHPQKGTIYLNDIPLSQFSLAQLRTQMSAILQDPEIFSGSFEENITLFDDQTPIDPSTELLVPKERLKKEISERGKSLSAGEKQLLALARAIHYKRPLLLLDEATANIDSRTERLIQKHLETILEKKTALIVAHRLTTIQRVNRIVVLDQGKICEEGTHEELLRRKGIYEKLYRLGL